MATSPTLAVSAQPRLAHWNPILLDTDWPSDWPSEEPMTRAESLSFAERERQRQRMYIFFSSKGQVLVYLW